MRARAFTLLETMLAASLGALLVLVCVALFAAVDRSQGRLAARARQTGELARLHLVVGRVFSTLVMTDRPPTRDEKAQAGASGARVSGGTRSRPTIASEAEGSAGKPENGEKEAGKPDEGDGELARLGLQPDASPLLEGMVRRARIAAGGSGSGIAAPQRLEVVVSRPPVPEGYAATIDRTLLQASFKPEPPDPMLAATRGAFELRPDRATRRTVEVADPGEGWTLWWRPLAAIDGKDPRAIDPTEDPRAVPLATGLVRCNWTVFVQRERRPALWAVSEMQLPAYVELEVQTRSGLTASWMFEVEWTKGPEFASSSDADGDGAGGPGDPGAEQRPDDRSDPRLYKTRRPGVSARPATGVSN